MVKKLPKERGAFILVCTLLLLLVGWYVFSLSSGARSTSTMASAIPGAVSVVDTTYVPAGTVVVRHTVVHGTHTYNGSLDIPADCDVLSTGVVASGSAPAHVSLALVVWRQSDCVSARGREAAPFSISFSNTAPASVVFDGVTVNNIKTPASLVEGK